ncbi:MAG: GNAT family N-acetyltransferase [Candidatus Beckwithbacteria bacterium]
MNNYQFLRDYQNLQYSLMFDQLIELGFCRISYCAGDNSNFWNQALTNQLLSSEQLKQIEYNLTKLNRQSTVYFENKKTLNQLAILLKTNKYNFSYEDSWLFYTKNSLDSSRFKQVKKISTEKELETFIKTFNSCYQKNDPQNAYGELGDYLKVTEVIWEKHHQNNRVEYFICFEKNEPVAVSSLTNYQQIGYISNVGSLKKVRGKGFGKLATLYCVAESIKQGNQYHCLTTEESTYADEFYKRIGFEKKFSAVAYTKTSP